MLDRLDELETMVKEEQDRQAKEAGKLKAGRGKDQASATAMAVAGGVSPP